MYMFEYLMNIFEDKMCVFGYLKIPDIILSLVSSQKLDWTHTFGTYCIAETKSFRALRKIQHSYRAEESASNILIIIRLTGSL